MNALKSILTIGVVATTITPLAALAEDGWITTRGEPGVQLVQPAWGSIRATPALPPVRATRLGDVSADGQLVYMGEGGGWQFRPMQYGFEAGRLVHRDDPPGHMNRKADNSPLTEQQRIALQRSGGQ